MSQHHVDSSTQKSSPKKKTLLTSRPYTIVPIPSEENSIDNIQAFSNPTVIVNELVNQQFSDNAQKRLSSQEILHITQSICNQEKTMKNRQSKVIYSSLVAFIVGFICIGLYVMAHNGLCSKQPAIMTCIQAYGALIFGCISISLSIIPLVLFYMTIKKIRRIKQLWKENLALLQQHTLLNTSS